MNFFDLREPLSAWSHCAWLLLALPGTMILWRRCGGDPGNRLSLVVFGLSLAFCAGASTLYHGARMPAQIAVYEVADYIGIYILIAGTVTPIASTLLRGRWRRGVLTTVWGLAATGAALNLICGVLPLWLITASYLVMGWGAVTCYVEIARVVPQRTLAPILLGGVLYSMGAVLNLLEWPVLWPGAFGHHELFHLFVMAGSFAHYWFMLTVVAPYRPVAAAVAPRPQPAQPAFGPAFRSGQISG